jgi:hypothetical protein
LHLVGILFLTKSVISSKATKKIVTPAIPIVILSHTCTCTWTYHLFRYENWTNYFIWTNMKFYSLLERIPGRRMATDFHFC